MEITLAEQTMIEGDDLVAELFGLLTSHLHSICDPLIDYRVERLALDVLWRLRPSEREPLRDHLLDGVGAPTAERAPVPMSELSAAERAIVAAEEQGGPIFDRLVARFEHLLAPIGQEEFADYRPRRLALEVLWQATGGEMRRLRRHLDAAAPDGTDG